MLALWVCAANLAGNPDLLPMKYKSLLLLSVCFSTLLANRPEKVINYEVSYLSVPLLNMTLTWVEDDSSVFISYDNQLKPFIAFFHPIHNIYRVHFRRDDYYPLGWSKSVSEGDMHFELSAQRSFDGREVTFSSGVQSEYPEGGFTIFSATHFLASKAQSEGFFPARLQVFIDGEIWEASATRYDVFTPHPDHSLEPGEVLIQTDLHYISGNSVVKKNDILTSVIATEGTRFLLWVAPDGSYTRAQFGKFPKAVVLKRVKN